MYIIFDLGGVICSFYWDKFLKSIEAVGTQPIEPKALNDLRAQLEQGKLSSFEFYKKLIALANADLSYDWFLELFSQYDSNLAVGDLINRIPKRYQLVLLSNTNAVHFESIFKELPVASRFSSHYLSYGVGLAKPDPKIFTLCMAELKPDSDVLFIDDSEKNVQAARQAGMVAHHYTTPFRLEHFLKINGVLT